MMNFAFIDESCYTREQGGSQTWTIRLTSALKERGIETKIYSYADGIKISIPDFIKMFPYIREGFVFPYIGWKLVRQIPSIHDMIFFTSISTAALYKTKTPAIATANCLFSRQTLCFIKYLPFRYKLFLNWLTYSFFKLLEIWSLNNVDHVIVPKREFKEFIITKLKQPAEKIHVIGYGIDTQIFKPPEHNKKREKMVLFVGRGTIAKGFDTVLEAADKIDGKIVVVASRISRGYLPILKQKKNVQVYTRITTSQLVELYQSASVFVLPSLTEGSALTTLEAMACGLPIVCTPEGGGGNIEDNLNGYIIPYRNPEVLAEKVNYLFNNPAIAEQFGQLNQKKISEHFTISKVTEEILKVIERAMSGCMKGDSIPLTAKSST